MSVARVIWYQGSSVCQMGTLLFSLLVIVDVGSGLLRLDRDLREVVPDTVAF